MYRNYSRFIFIVAIAVTTGIGRGVIHADDLVPGAPPVPAKKPHFNKASFWYQELNRDVPLHPDSDKLTVEFLRQKKLGKNGQDDLVGINTRCFASPVYIADLSTPTIPVEVDRCESFPEEAYQQLEQQFKAVPFPAGAEPADGTDMEMTIYQPSTDTLWEFWRLQKQDGRWKACWGGRLDCVSTTYGIWQKPFGATATGLPFIGGQITYEELKSGEIRHAMGIALVQAKDKNADEPYSWPATRTDGCGCNGSNCIPEGIRFRLDPSINVDCLDMHPVGKVIAKAAQKYGFVVWDKADTTSLRAENPKSYAGPDPYPSLWGEGGPSTVLNGFPWEKLQFLPLNYGISTARDTALNEWRANSNQVDELLQRWFPETGPGAAVMVIKDHQVIYQGGRGLASLTGDRKPITSKTLFQIASMTKQFTAMGIAILCDKGLLNLDDSVADRLNDCNPKEIKFTAKDVKIRHLLQHTAGLQEYHDLFQQLGMLGRLEFRSSKSVKSPFEPDIKDVLDVLKFRELAHIPPGNEYHYGNTGYILAAAVIEKVSDKKLGAFLDENIFLPLEMTSTFVNDADHPLRPCVSNSYDFDGVGSGDDIDYTPLNKIYGHVGVYTNLDDLYKWDQALYKFEKQHEPKHTLVPDDMLDQIFSSGTLNDGRTKTGYGFGWIIDSNGSVWHNGEWAGYRSIIVRYPNEGYTVVVLSNLATTDSSAIFRSIDKIYYPPTDRGLPRPTRQRNNDERLRVRSAISVAANR